METQLIQQKTRFVAFQTGQDQSTNASEHFGLLSIPRSITQASNDIRELLAKPILHQRTSMPFHDNYFVVDFNKADFPNLEIIQNRFRYYSFDVQVRLVVTAHLQVQYTMLYTTVYHKRDLMDYIIKKDEKVLSDNPYGIVSEREPDVTINLPWLSELDAFPTDFNHTYNTTPWPALYMLQLHPLMATANAPSTVPVSIFYSLTNVKWDYYDL